MRTEITSPRDLILPLGLVAAWIALLVALSVHFQNWRIFGLLGFAVVLLLPWTLAAVRGKPVDVRRTVVITVALVIMCLALAAVLWKVLSATVGL